MLDLRKKKIFRSAFSNHPEIMRFSKLYSNARLSSKRFNDSGLKKIIMVPQVEAFFLPVTLARC